MIEAGDTENSAGTVIPTLVTVPLPDEVPQAAELRTIWLVALNPMHETCVPVVRPENVTAPVADSVVKAPAAGVVPPIAAGAAR